MADTSLDAKSISELIGEFRKLTAKDSITPETLGYILQRITDLLATCGTHETSEQLLAWFNTMKQAANYVTSIVQNPSDRNHVYLDLSLASPTGDVIDPNTQRVQIQQATTERAGAMRAQHVDDLYTAKKNITALQKERQVHLPIHAEDANGNFINAYCIRHGIMCTVIGDVYLEMENTSFSCALPYEAAYSNTNPTVMIYDDATMQWLNISVGQDINGTHLWVRIPEDYMNGMEASAQFCLSYVILDTES